MSSTNSESYDAFISFAEPDKQLAEELWCVLRDVGLTAYYSKEDLGRRGSADWRGNIHNAIKSSRCFLPVMTRSSIGRPWVLYEAGAADALGRPTIAARVDDLSTKELKEIPSGDVWAHQVSNEKGLQDLVLAIARARDGDGANETTYVRAMETSSHVANVLRLARTRWVFVAGSRPHGGAPYLPRVSVADRSGLAGEGVLTHIARDLTRSLLGAGFSVISCPEVPHVGAVVTETAMDLMESQESIPIDRFRLGGLYPTVRLALIREASPSRRATVSAWLDDYRAKYLAPAEWILVLGGNDGTEDEVRIARDENTKVCALRALGGASERITPTPTPPPNCRFADDDLIWCSEVRDQLIAHLLGAE